MISGPQIRAARELLGWDLSRLAFLSRVRLASLIRAEGAEGEPAISATESAALERVLATAGVELFNDEAGAPAVRLRSGQK